MSRLKKIAPVAALAALAATATPALAAPHANDGFRGGNGNFGYHGSANGKHYAGFGQAAQLKRDIARLDARIDRALAHRQISTREGFTLHRDVRELQRLYNRFATGGMTRWEARTLESRIAQANRAFIFERRDRDGRRG